MFQTRYGNAVAQVLAAYGVVNPSPALIAAMETLIKTAQDHAEIAGRDKIAQSVCEGLHKDDAAGLKCLKCYNAEHHFNEEIVVSAEISGSAEDSAPEADPDSQV